MAISENLKNKSVEQSITIANTDIVFKATELNLHTIFSSDFDDSFAISSNSLEFYHAYQTDNEFRVGVNYTSGIQFTPNPNYKITTPISTKICLLYTRDSIDSVYTREERNFYIYSNNSKTQNYGNLNNFTGFKIVTDFDFSRLVLSSQMSNNRWNRDNYNYLYYDNITSDTTEFDKEYITLWYRTDDFKLINISGNFVLAEIVKTENDTIVNMLSFRNLLGEQQYSSSQITEAVDFTNNCVKINNNVFIHTTSSDILTRADNMEYYKPTDEKTGLFCVFQYSGGYQCYYDITVNKYLGLNILSAIGLRFITCNPNLITDKTSYETNIKIAYMDETGFVDHTNIIVGEKAINDSDTSNKNIDLNTSPNIPDTPNPYPSEKDKIEPTDYRLTNEIGGFTRYYKVSRANLASIISKINTATDIPDGYEFLPHIVSVRQYPFNTSNYAMGHSENITIGGYDTGVTGLNLDSTQLAVQTIATITIPRKYNNFLDKSPYTQLSLYIPCCSWVDLPDICVGKTITVDLAHDIINGSCIGIVKLDGMPIVQTTGSMGTDISISAIENGLRNASTTQAMFSVGGGVLSTGYALSTGNPVGVVSGIMSTVASISQGNIANNSNYTHQIGSTQSKAKDHINTRCYLRISFPIPDIPDSFGHTYGHICNEQHTLSECSGFTVCENVDLNGFNCTETEKQMIKTFLESGCYL